MRRTSMRRRGGAPNSLGALAVAVLAAPAVLLGSGAAASAPPGEAEIPVLATFEYQPPQAEVGTYVGAVHAVRRIEGATVVYWSLGQREPDQGEVDLFRAIRTRGDFNDVTRGTSVNTVRMVDAVGKTVYLPLLDDTSTCLCSAVGDMPDEAGMLNVVYAVFAPLPAEVETVDLDLSGYGTVVTQVPVDDGEPLEPASAQPYVPLGEGWPELPSADTVAAALQATERDPVWDLVVNTGIADGSARTSETSEEIVVDLASDVLFDFDSANLTGEATSRLQEVAADITARATGPVQVVGHTDSQGDTGYNQNLSEQRAQAVAAVLEPLVEPRLEVSGRGESEPVADNATPEGQALNRRVTISFAVGDGS